MFYLITNQENHSWRNILWQENTTNEDDNPNYYFSVYKSLQVAKYMYPAYEGYLIGKEGPKIWEAHAENPTQEDGIRAKFPKLTTIKELTLNLPTKEQRITFGILCSLNLVQNPIYREWAINYLLEIDQSKETTQETIDELQNEEEKKKALEKLEEIKKKSLEKVEEVRKAVWDDRVMEEGVYAEPDEMDRDSCTHAVFASILIDPVCFSANAAHRAYHDSLSFKEELNLQQIAEIVDMLPPKDIAEMLF